MLPKEPSFKHFKNICVCCERTGQPMNKEHLYPKWLLERTQNMGVPFPSPYGEIAAGNLTIPLCIECNSKLGRELEAPVSRVFESIESGNGFGDYDAELLIRWIWKITGMYYWSMCHENWRYGWITLKEHVLSNICAPRERISIAVSLIDDEYEDVNYAPVGIDVLPWFSNVYAAGVFSKLAIVVLYTRFVKYLDPQKWTVFTLNAAPPHVLNPNNRCYPRVGFSTGSEAINYVKTQLGTRSLMSFRHEKIAIDMRGKALERTLSITKHKA